MRKFKTWEEVEKELNLTEEEEEEIKREMKLMEKRIQARKKSISDDDYNEYIEDALDEAEKEAENPNTKYLSNQEVFGKERKN